MERRRDRSRLRRLARPRLRISTDAARQRSRGHRNRTPPGSLMPDPVQDPAWTRILSAARRSLERTGGDLNSIISLNAPTEAERLLVIGITGVHRTAGANRLAVRLADLDAYFRNADGRGLNAVIGPSLRNRPAERAAEAAAREDALAQAVASRHHDTEWFQRWLAD